MLFDIALLSAAMGCTLVSGFLFGFAVVALPGMARLDDRGFVRTFQVMDRVIQDRQPLFVLVWVGSVVAVVAAVLLGLGALTGGPRLLLIVAALLYLAGVQGPTAAVNIPLNNEIQRVDVAATDDAGVAAARERFEARWNRWNRLRTTVGCVASLALLVLLLWR